MIEPKEVLRTKLYAENLKIERIIFPILTLKMVTNEEEFFERKILDFLENSKFVLKGKPEYAIVDNEQLKAYLWPYVSSEMSYSSKQSVFAVIYYFMRSMEKYKKINDVANSVEINHLIDMIDGFMEEAIKEFYIEQAEKELS